MDNTSLENLEAKRRELIGLLRTELSGIRTNRPSPKLVEELRVEYLGQQLPVKQLASIGVNMPREIVITAWDKNAAPLIAKAIQNSSLGVSPRIDGGMVRFELPPITQERREELARVVRAIGEKIRIRVRAARDEANKAIGAGFEAKTVTEDEKFRGKKKIQEVTDATQKEIDAMLEEKVKEISE